MHRCNKMLLISYTNNKRLEDPVQSDQADLCSLIYSTVLDFRAFAVKTFLMVPLSLTNLSLTSLKRDFDKQWKSGSDAAECRAEISNKHDKNKNYLDAPYIGNGPNHRVAIGESTRHKWANYFIRFRLSNDSGLGGIHRCGYRCC